MQGRLGRSIWSPRLVALDGGTRCRKNDTSLGLTQLRNGGLDLAGVSNRYVESLFGTCSRTNARALKKLMSYNFFHSSTVEFATDLIGSSAPWLMTTASILPPNFTARSVTFVAFCHEKQYQYFDLWPFICVCAYAKVCQIRCQVFDLRGILVFQRLEFTFSTCNQHNFMRFLQQIVRGGQADSTACAGNNDSLGSHGFSYFVLGRNGLFW